MFELKVITGFAAAHQLQMVSQKCENLHGHNWKIEIYVQGNTLDEAGVLVDFGIIKKYVREIMQGLDHKFLNELEMFGDKKQPSSENIARYVAEELEAKIGDDNDNVKVAKVCAWESDDACAAYIKD